MAGDDARPADQDRPPAAGLHRANDARLPRRRGPLNVPRVRVLGAALLCEDPPRVLASRRTAPPHLAGLWEFPGGKVEPGESDEQALLRELREELGCEAVVGEQLGGDLLIGPTAVLRVYLARLVAGKPQLVDHDEHRWLTADQLDDVRWLPVDAPLVDLLRVRLAGPRSTPAAGP